MNSSKIIRKRPQVAPDAQAYWDKLKKKELKDDRKTIEDTIYKINPEARFFIRYCKKGKTVDERFSLSLYDQDSYGEAQQGALLRALREIKLSIPLERNTFYNP